MMSTAGSSTTPPSTKLNIQDVTHEEVNDQDTGTASQPQEEKEQHITAESPVVNQDSFTFHVLSDTIQEALPCLKEREFKDNLIRWNLEPFMTAARLSYEEKLSENDQVIDQFLRDLFNSDAIRQALPVVSSGREKVKLTGTVDKVEWEELHVSVTTMSFFDKLQDEGVVTQSGLIKRCFDDTVNGVTIGDELRKIFVSEDAEYGYLFDDDERSEFLWQLYRTVVTGGSLCQYDDKWDEYNETVKRLYKDMLAVYKESTTGKIKVASRVFRIHGFEEDSSARLFPEENDHNSCYVAIDFMRRIVTVWYSAWLPFW